MWTSILTHRYMERLLTQAAGKKPTGFILIGIRVPVDPAVQQVDRWVDLLGYWTPTTFRYYSGTTRAGLDGLLRPINKEGTAIVVPGYYPRVYQRGLHGISRGAGHQAFRQVGKLRFWRDANRDSKWDKTGKIYESAQSCLNFHGAPQRGGTLATRVGMHSVGCQVVQRMSSLKEITDAADKSGQSRFDYFLVELDLNSLK